MSEQPADRCGHLWPDQFDPAADPDHQSCCYRETLPDTDRCAWHADPERTDEKTVEALREASSPPEVRAGNSPFDELLDGAELSRTRLGSEISLASTALRGADLRDADLSDADLTGADLHEATLAGANLAGADLSGAYLVRADLSGATLRGADLRDANLYEADLPGADLREALLADAEPVEADLSGAILNGADLSGASLRGTDLRRTDLRADLDDAVLSRSDLSGASLQGTDLRRTDLPAGETLREADLSDVDLRGQDLRGVDLSGAALPEADLTGADLRGADLSGADVERALLNRADLFDTRFSRSRLEGAVFGDVKLNERTFENLAPDNPPDGDPPGMLARWKRRLRGPTGDDRFRCVYDPKGPDGRPERAEDDGRDPPEARAGSVYRAFERLAADNVLPDWERRFFLLRKDMETRRLRLEGSRFDYWFAAVQRSLFGYGEGFWRVIGWSGLIIGLFAVIYLIGGWIHPVRPGGGLRPPLSWTRLPEAPGVVWGSVYYSTLTFTALGFGDFRPVGALGQLLTTVETGLGAVILALLVFVLGRRAAR